MLGQYLDLSQYFPLQIKNSYFCIIKDAIDRVEYKLSAK